MKNSIIFVILMVITIDSSYACEICGCSSGNYFIGPFPQFNSLFIGARYSFEKYGTVLNDDRTQFSNDLYQTAEIIAGTNIRNKWQLLMFVPFDYVYSKSDDGIGRNSGLGDMTLMGNYHLFDKRYLNSDTVTVSQQLWIGGGVKLPTGKFSVDSGELITSANQQPGTGSFDYMFNLIYSFQIKSWGLNMNVNYRVNQYADNYKFGNRLNGSAFIYHTFHIRNISVSPNIGLLYEILDPNRNNHKKVADTGGHVFLSALGFEIRFLNIALGLNDQIPVASDLSNGQTNAQTRAMCHLSYIF